MRTLLFDIDGTLLSTDGAGSTAIANVFRHEFDIPEPRIDLDFSGKTDGFLIAEILRRNGLSDHDDLIERFRNKYFQHFPAAMLRCGGRLMPGVIELVKQCAEHPSIRSFVMTGNCVFTGTEKLKHFNLLGYFRQVFGADHDTHRNDLAKRTLAELAQQHDWTPAEPLVVIGDTPADVTCGQAIGAITVAVATGRHHYDELASANPVVLCRDLTDPRAIAAIVGPEPSLNTP